MKPKANHIRLAGWPRLAGNPGACVRSFGISGSPFSAQPCPKLAIQVGSCVQPVIGTYSDRPSVSSKPSGLFSSSRLDITKCSLGVLFLKLDNIIFLINTKPHLIIRFRYVERATTLRYRARLGKDSEEQMIAS